MTEIPDTSKISTSLPLIFWGAIIGSIRTPHDFGIIQLFGMFLVLYGVVTLGNIPVSKRYRKGMLFVTGAAAFVLTANLISHILLSIKPTHLPSGMMIAVFLFFVLVLLLGILVFCRCMAEYCSTVRWPTVFTSWKYSAGLVKYGVLFPLAVLAVPLFLFFNAMEFELKNSQKITYHSTVVDGQSQLTVFKNGKVIDIKTASLGESITTCSSDYEPSGKQWAVTLPSGEWVASSPFGNTVDYGMTLALMAVALAYCWAFIHVLVSLSRMANTAKRIPFSKISAALCQNY